MSNPYEPPTTDPSPEAKEKWRFVRTDLRTQVGMVSGVVGGVLMILGAFLPVMTMLGETTVSFSSSKDWILLIIAGAVGGLWAFIGRRSMQTLACLFGLLATLGFYFTNKQRLDLMSSVTEAIGEATPKFGLGFWCVLIAAICFGVSSMTNLDPKKLRKKLAKARVG